jgi:hypothetical protein
LNPDELRKLIEEDEFGLLDVKPKACNHCTADERLINSFEEINDFFDKTGHEPQDSDDILEKKLYFRLNNLREDVCKKEALAEYDRHNLLEVSIKEINSIDDILNDDDFGMFDDDEEDIFTLKHLPKEINMPDYIGRHKPCKDFEKFEQLFVQCHQEIKEGKRDLSTFQKEQAIDVGMFFVLKGVLVYIAEVGDFEYVNGKRRARLRCIYDNGTESDILNRSLARALYRDGKRVSPVTEKVLDKFVGITEEDKESGYIYILQSLSPDEKIQSIADLYKIGFSTTPVLQRIKNAEQEPTYLMAPVRIVAEYKTFNMNTQKFELLLHNFLGHCCVSIDITDKNGVRRTPREWFSVPYEVVNQAIQLIISGEVVNYKYDRGKREIIYKENN